jgi:diketogulonate reductase-like aldo/keto reductase
MIKLTERQRVPALGLGTWRLRGEDCCEAARDALTLGYRHIDTAQGYDNEAEVGQGILDADVVREEIPIPRTGLQDHGLRESGCTPRARRSRERVPWNGRPGERSRP